MKETAVRSRKGGGKSSSHCAASMPCGINSPKSSLHVCPHCRRAFPFNVALQLHIKDHLVQNTFKCSLCPAGFSSKYQLSVHLRRHAGLDLFKCDQCSVKFINASNLQRHIRNGVCQKAEEPNGGNDEGYSNSSKAVDVHTLSGDTNVQTSSACDALGILVVTNQQSCEACNETFTNLEDYSHHEDLHKTGNIFKCRNCSKNFCTLPRLSGETLGEDEKYWRNKCMLCGATCHSDNDLFMHLRRHLDNNEDLYCKQCQSNRIDSESKGNTSVLIVDNGIVDDVSTEKPREADPASCLYSVTSPDAAPPATNSLNNTLTLPFQTTTYLTTHLSNVSNIVTGLYQQSDTNSIQPQQRVLQPVCSLLPAVPPCGTAGSIDLCADGPFTQTSGVLATASPCLFVLDPAMQRSSANQSFSCTAQMVSTSTPVDSRGPVSSWPSPVTATSAAGRTTAPGTRGDIPSVSTSSPQNLVSYLAANTQTILSQSGNCYTNHTFCCLPTPQQ